MNRSLQETFGIIQKTLGEEGFKLAFPKYATYRQCQFVLGDELWTDDRISGYSLNVEAVCSHNDQIDVNYRIEIMQWNNSSGHAIDKIKIIGNQTEKTIAKKVKSIVEKYKKIVYEAK